jgi:hypothetical protein
VCYAGAFTIAGCGGVACGPGGLLAWATGGRLYRFFEVELHTQVGDDRDNGFCVCGVGVGWGQAVQVL